MKIRLSKEGLTLMELLVVIGIIAVLAGIIWIVFGSIKMKVRETVCFNNLRVLSHALQMYRQDWDGIDPEKGRYLQCYEVAFIPWCNLNPSLKQYGVARENLICPSDPEGKDCESRLWWEPWIIPYDTYSCAGSYGPHWWGYKKDVFPDHHRIYPPLPQLLAERGMDYPVWHCSWHGLERKEYPYRALVARLNGQVEIVRVTYGLNPWEF